MSKLSLKVFVASPGDVSTERDTVAFVVEELRRTIGDIRNVELQTVRWETHTWPDVGADAQDVINTQIGEYDVFVGVMWRRFGTPTQRSRSGTGEEFEKAYDLFRTFGRPKIMFYFRTTPFYSTDEGELRQFRKVIAFRKKLQKLGVLFWQYDQPLTFERDVREHLMRQVLQLTESGAKSAPSIAPSTPQPARIFLSGAHEDAERVTRVYKALVAAGFAPWMDAYDMSPGDDWSREIDVAIRAADFCLIFVSETSVSRAGYFNRETRTIFEVNDYREARIIPVRLDPVELPQQFAKSQPVDLLRPDDLHKLVDQLKAEWRLKAEAG